MKGLVYSGYGEFKNWRLQSFGQVDSEDAVYFVKELKETGLSPLQGKRVLELGFGNGAFAAWATGQGCEYMGVEVIPELVHAARSRGFNAFGNDIALTQIAGCGSIDLIVAFDVCEHLSEEELRSLLKECSVILKPGGHILGRVPSGDSPFSRAMQHGDLTHRLLLGSAAIRQLAMGGGFRVEAIRSPVYPVVGLGARSLLRRALVKLVRVVSYPVIVNVFMGGGKLVLTPDLVFVLRKA